jgi:hypothetical protein
MMTRHLGISSIIVIAAVLAGPAAWAQRSLDDAVKIIDQFRAESGKDQGSTDKAQTDRSCQTRRRRGRRRKGPAGRRRSTGRSGEFLL